MNPTVLLVDDEPRVLGATRDELRGSGICEVATLEDSREVVPLLQVRPISLIVLDLTMPHLGGRQLLEILAADFPDIPVIVMTASSELDTAVHCMQIGAVDYLLKPVERARLLSAVQRALENRALRAEVLQAREGRLPSPSSAHPAFAELVTQNRSMRAIFRILETVARSSQPVLIAGEGGTGKRLAALAVHRISGQAGQFVEVNVAGWDDQMFTDTLFGHVRGALGDKDRGRDGQVVNAASGTLFIEDIAELSVTSQVKLLRLVQDGTFYPLGADQARPSRARYVLATQCDIRSEVSAGRFRRDLYYRMQMQHVDLPALRARRADLPLLVEAFVERAATAMGKTAPAISPALYQLLNTYAFPGNVRELEAMCFDAMARHEGNVLALRSFRETIAASRTEPPAIPVPVGTEPAAWLSEHLPGLEQLPNLKEAEWALVTEAMRRANGNQGVAAGLLGMKRGALHQRLARHRKSTR